MKSLAAGLCNALHGSATKDVLTHLKELILTGTSFSLEEGELLSVASKNKAGPCRCTFIHVHSISSRSITLSWIGLDRFASC